MKILISLVVILLVAVGLMAVDDQMQRTNTAQAQKTIADTQDQVKQDAVQINALNSQILQFKAQIVALQAQKTTLESAAAAAAPAVPTPTPAPAVQAPAQPVAQTSTQIVADYSNALAIIEGKN